ncbi:MAG: hypothetical protein GX250_02600 [Clostridiales bacterium]|nr:hypothetical protein [Clostridiales bacterium]
MNGTYAIGYEGREVGSLKVYNEGLMTVFIAETLPLSGVWRIAIESGGLTVPIGVLVPSQRGLYLKKSFTKNMLAQLNIQGIDGVSLLSKEHSEAPGWKPVQEPSSLFSDSDLKAASRGSKGVIVLKENEITKAAFPIRSDMPFALMPAFCLGKPLKISGNDYLVFTIKDGNIFA